MQSSCIKRILFNPFYATGLALCPLNISENLWLPDVFKRYRERPKAQNEVKISVGGKAVQTSFIEPAAIF